MKTTMLMVGALATMLTADTPGPSSPPHPQERPAIEGTWSARLTPDDAERAGRIELSRWDDRRSWNSKIDLSADVVRDLLRQASEGDGSVRYALRREAGTLDLEGHIRGNRGSGDFTFREDPSFRDRMAAAGFRGLDADEVFASALHGVGVAQARELQSLGFDDLDFDDLMAAAIFEVDGAFVQEMRAAGLGRADMDDLVAMKIHGVTPTFLAEMEALDLDLDFDEALAFRIHGITPDFIRDAGDMGFRRLDFDDVVAMKIHGVTRAYVDAMAEDGFRFSDVDDALAFRIHGITREFLEELRDQGFEDLSADEVLEIRILGLDRILRKRIR